MAEKEKREILTRTVTWPLTLTTEQEQLILRINDGLREYESLALEAERQNHLKYKEIMKGVADGLLFLSTHTANDGKKYKLVRVVGMTYAALLPKSFLSAIDLYSNYVPLREVDERKERSRATIPANWVLESCFRKVESSYKAFFEATKRGDPDTRTIKPSEPTDFVALQGALNKGSLKGNQIVLAPTIYPGMFKFNIPAVYQATMLAQATRLAKFVISRDPSDLRQPGRFWLSISYEIPKPETKPRTAENTVGISLGAFSIGVAWSDGAEVIRLNRPDMHWMPQIEKVKEQMTCKGNGKDRRPLQKGSKKWKWLEGRRHRMYGIMSTQQKNNRREIVAERILKHSVSLDRLSETMRRFCRRKDRLVRPSTDDLGFQQFANELSRDEAVLFGRGVHVAVTEVVIRSKEGKLADASKPERSGSLGLNWMAQNTAAMGYLVLWLEQKVLEYGGSVTRIKLEHVASGSEVGDEKKILMAQAVRDNLLTQ